MEWLAGLNVVDAGATTLLIVVFLAMLTGKIPTVRELDNARKDGAEWRRAYEAQLETNRVQGESLVELLMLARTSDHALRTIQSMGAAAFAAGAEKDRS